MNSPLIVVSGNLGVGKSTFATLLERHFGWQLYLESLSENPYLHDFYQDIPRWAFHLQVYFLGQRVLMHKEAALRPNGAVLDRCVYEDRHIFAEALKQSGSISDRDFNNYVAIYEASTQALRPIDLVVYLRAPLSVLQDRIRQRSIDFDQSIPSSYLQQIEEKYKAWTASIPPNKLLIIDTESINFTTEQLDSSSMLKLFKKIKDLL